MKACLLAASYVMLAPCTLASLRLTCCTGSRLAADPSVTCGSGGHAAATTMAMLVSGSFVFFSLYQFYWIAHDNTLYASPNDHEKTLQRREIEWELGIDDEWAIAQMWVVTSFKRSGVRHRFAASDQKLLLVICYTSLRGLPSLQAFLF